MKKYITLVLSIIGVSSQAQSWKAVLPGPDNPVNCLVTDTVNNLLYVGGGITGIGAVNANRIAVYNGSTWSPLGAGFDMDVTALVMYNGELYAGGNFTKSGSSTVNYIAKWDGTNWQSLGTGMNNYVQALTVHNGALYAGGDFTTAGGVTVNHIAKWDGGSWSAVANGFDGSVSSLLSYNGDLYTGGWFTKTGNNVSMNGISKWDGNNWQSLYSGVSGGVMSLCIYKNELYAGGNFSQAGDSIVKNIAKWNGTIWSSLNSQFNGSIFILKVHNGELYAGGDFWLNGNTFINRVALYNGTLWNNIGDGLSGSGFGNTVKSFCVYKNEIYAGGRFSYSGNVTVSNIARWPKTAVPKIDQDKTILCKGNCTKFYDKSYNFPSTWTWTFTGGVPASSNSQNPVVCYNTAGVYPVSLKTTNQYGSDSATYNSYIKVVAPISPNFKSIGADFNGSVYAIEFDSTNNILYVGGQFTKVNGITANYIAKYDGNTWSPLGKGMNNAVYTLKIYKGDLYAGGTFMYADSLLVNFIARWNGSNWNSLSTGLDGDPHCLEIFNNELYIGGDFIYAGGIVSNDIVKWNGSAWLALPKPSPAMYIVDEIEIYNGELYIAGGGAGGIQKWNGTSWIVIGSFGGGNVFALGTYKNALIAGGSFSSIGALPVNNLAKWDGVNWSSIGGPQHGSNNVFSIKEYNNALYVAGGFNNIIKNADTIPVDYIAKYDGNNWEAVGSGVNKKIQAIEFINDELYIAGAFTLVNGCDYANGLAKWPTRPQALFSLSDSSICIGDSLQIINQSKNTSNWSWTLTGGTPSSSVQENPTIVYNNSGKFDIKVVVSNIFRNDSLTLNNCITVSSCKLVWPGDANNDSIVTNGDLLPIGLYYSQAGLPRSSVSNTWQGYLSADWGTIQANGSDIKHVDCNGDGTINSSDTLAINLNFNLTHAITPNNNYNQERLIAPDLYFVTSSNTYNSGDLVDVEVRAGTSALPVNNLYGIAFNINYNASLVQPGTESITYPNSWLGIPGTNAIKISKIDALANTAYGAESRINHINADGYGKIANFKFQLKNSIPSDTKMYFSISAYEANDSIGIPVLFNLLNDSILINPISTGIKEISTSLGINIHPNPFTSQTTISFNQGVKNVTIRIVDILGKEIRKINFSGNQLIIEKGELQSGIYFLQVVSEDEMIANEKIVIQ